MRNMIASLRWGVAAAGIHVAFLAVFLLSACTDVGDRDNPLDPGASNYVAQDENGQTAEDDSLNQLIDDIKNGVVDTSDGFSQELIDSVKSGAVTVDDLRASSSSKMVASSSSKNVRSSSSETKSVSSSDTPASSSEKVQPSSSVSSVFSIMEYLNPNVEYDSITDDRDGQIYKTVNINGRVWMAQNLNFETEKSVCQGDKKESCAKFGRLYAWGDALDSAGIYGDKAKGCGRGILCEMPPAYEMIRGVCPEGFHLPSTVEFSELVSIAGTDGAKMKSKKTWSDGGSDDYGFSALQAGRKVKDTWHDGESYMWSISQANKYAADALEIVEGWDHVIRMNEANKDEAYSLRCLQDYEVLGELTDDRDGQKYKTIRIGSQNWMAENLNYAYLQGTSTEDSSSYCLDNIAENCNKYGRLYLWGAAMDSAAVYSETGKDCGDREECSPSYPVRGVCPKGWHLPTAEEFRILGQNGGYALKSTTAWHDGENGSDFYGFNAIPAGAKGYVGDDCTNALNYDACENAARFWTSTEHDYASALIMSLGAEDDNEPKHIPTEGKGYALSVRCIED
ncbi:MAG: hypothetical protein IK114_08025 [Fibrobacter sp.]|nr:hypothetical protein [Fibrobacter sp.]